MKGLSEESTSKQYHEKGEGLDEKDKEKVAAAATDSISEQVSKEEVRTTKEQQDQSLRVVVKDAADEGKEGASNAAIEEKHRKLRQRLERAVQSENVAVLEPAVETVKKEKVPECSELLDKVNIFSCVSESCN